MEDNPNCPPAITATASPQVPVTFYETQRIEGVFVTVGIKGLTVIEISFGTKGSEVQIFPSRPLKTMGYGLGRSPFFVVGNRMGNK